ncbi:DUF1963 domain-containing protein [Streptomyces pseudovenezuelae]|uniref:DUF1963 domain-containing protein n=1 Tax=Streptomyces pseudovenezuelae TaxID=67350 RepID=A0ABT6LBF4_9ACTN|nr:DUF1963 domain-containing protein [Streptomyces pseudovenezuelae]MDH6213613.1 hypothetical protein [Streptomyces pseudovenezuelae]
MTSELRDRLGPFRDAAISRGIPAEDVERWLDLARPCATLSKDGDGPMVGRFGGPLLLPADAPDPYFPFVASIDLAALPADATDLSLPADGHLLLFAFPEGEGDLANMGEVVYVAAGTAVTERDKNAGPWSEVDEYQELIERFPQEELRATTNVSLPYHGAVETPEVRYSQPLPGHPHSKELARLWDDVLDDIVGKGPLQIGGYASEEAVYLDPVAAVVHGAVTAAQDGRWGGGEAVSADVGDWVLLADWDPGIDGIEGATVHWAMQREDLAAHRFDRTYTTVFWNP